MNRQVYHVVQYNTSLTCWDRDDTGSLWNVQWPRFIPLSDYHIEREIWTCDQKLHTCLNLSVLISLRYLMYSFMKFQVVTITIDWLAPCKMDGERLSIILTPLADTLTVYSSRYTVPLYRLIFGHNMDTN